MIPTMMVQIAKKSIQISSLVIRCASARDEYMCAFADDVA